MKKLREWSQFLTELGIDSENGAIKNSIKTENWLEAESKLEKWLASDPKNKNHLASLAYVYEQNLRRTKAMEQYRKLLSVLTIKEKQKLIKWIKEFIGARKPHVRSKVAFIVKPGLDSFINPLIQPLADQYEIKKVIVTDEKQIDEAMDWADICWFEWCDDLVIYGSKLSIAKQKKLICRLHSFEAFTNYIYRVNWSNVDQIIFVGKHIEDYVLMRVPVLRNRSIVIPNGVDLQHYTFKERKKGYKLAVVGYINHKKGPMLLLHAFKALYERDDRYKLFIAGNYQDVRYQLYFEQMIKELNLEDAIQFDGWVKDVNSYLEDKDYIMTTSPLESQQMSIMEAMAKGIKPLIHNFYGAKEVYEKQNIWNTIDELVDMVEADSYSSAQYRNEIETFYSLEQQIKQTQKILDLLFDSSEKESFNDSGKITIGIINHNNSEFIDECILSIVNQSYPNKEILIMNVDLTEDSIKEMDLYMNHFPNVQSLRAHQDVETDEQAIQVIFEKANGEYVFIIKADDYMTNDRVLEECIECFHNDQELDYVYGDSIVLNQNREHYSTWEYRNYSSSEAILTIFRRWGSGVIPMNGLFKKEFFKDKDTFWVADHGLQMAGDTFNCVNNLIKGWKVYHVKKPLLSQGSSDSNHSINVRITAITKIMEHIVEHADEEVYLPQVEWRSLGTVDRQILKPFLIGETYRNMIHNYQVNSFTKHLSQQEKVKCVQPLIVMMNKHFEKSLGAGEDYREKIEGYRNEIQIMKEGAHK